MGWFGGDDGSNGVNTAFPSDTSGDFDNSGWDSTPASEQGNDGNDSGDSGNK